MISETAASWPQTRHLDSIETILSASVLESSRGRRWPGIEVMRARIPGDMLDVDGLRTHTLAINTGRPFTLKGRIEGRDVDGDMPTGAIKLVAAGPRSAWHWDGRAAIEMLHVSLDAVALQAYAAELETRTTPEIATRVGFIDPELGRIGAAFAQELYSPFTGSLIPDALRIELILRLLAGHSSLAGRGAIRIPKARIGQRALRLIEAYVEAHLGDDIGIGELAALAGMSRFHFSRVFGASTGVTPYQYVLSRRLERARELLRSQTLPLRDVATLTGFADQSHLTRLMKRRYGMTPGALRAS
jgi:AraC family transcriptional regulator